MRQGLPRTGSYVSRVCQPPHEVQRAKRKAIRDAAREAGTLAPIGMTQAEFNKIPREETT